MNWKSYWQKHSSLHSDPQKKVGRMGVSTDAKLDKGFSDTLQHLEAVLDLKSHEKLLDLCCGNGLVSKELSKNCQEIFGVDFTNSLIQEALGLNLSNASFACGDILKLHSLLGDEKFDKALLHFSLQYFGYADVSKILDQVHSSLKPGGLFLISDIPDAGKWSAFYRSPSQKIRYYWQKIQGKEEMGSFFRSKELIALAEKKSFKAKVIKQAETLPYAHYRFDLLLEKF